MSRYDLAIIRWSMGVFAIFRGKADVFAAGH